MLFNYKILFIYMDVRLQEDQGLPLMYLFRKKKKEAKTSYWLQPNGAAAKRCAQVVHGSRLLDNYGEFCTFRCLPFL